LEEARSLAAGGVREIVLVAQDLASYGRDRAGPSSPPRDVRLGRPAPIVNLTREVAAVLPRTRLLYLYPSQLTDDLVSAVLDTGVPYFDLSLQHVSRPHLARMRRWGDGERFLERIDTIRRAEAAATFRSSFILGYPGETESDHDQLLDFLRLAELDWAGFFSFSPEEGTPAATLPGQVPGPLALERLRECAELQDEITARRRDALVGRILSVLVDEPGRARSVGEAPEIDGLVRVPAHLDPGGIVDVEIVEAIGPDLVGRSPASFPGEGR
jgi:tRNA A37 methylthiotransferase MiaB